MVIMLYCRILRTPSYCEKLRRNNSYALKDEVVSHSVWTTGSSQGNSSISLNLLHPCGEHTTVLL